MFEDRVEEIATVDRALNFLRRWPEDRRGHVYQCTWNACNAVSIGRVSELDAMRTFIGFAEVTGIYVRAEDLPFVAAKPREPLFKKGHR
ncbi:DUF982 domain-containing protein [Mesorhizobium sp. NPDC059054]|uniref:DUF982 domain-containing protein n=1 Tax=Mesorhizobium sp. NPDC059054 TaxID=3346711 RepID=UPI0036A41114